MFVSKQQTWVVVDIGSRWIKCVLYVMKQGMLEEQASEVIDIREEGLLSVEEVSEAIGRMIGKAGAHPLAVVLPQSAAVAQVMDLPNHSAGNASDIFMEEISELIGVSAERCVYDRTELRPFGGYAEPQWITVAREEDLSRLISPLLGQGLRVEAATSAGNALFAAFQHTHAQVKDACLVDIGATQTTLVRLHERQVIQMTSFINGGEDWVEALVKSSGEAFEELEAQLFREDLFVEPVFGPRLLTAVNAWRFQVMQQLGEWQREPGMKQDGDTGDMGVYLYGGYSRIQGLTPALNQADGLSWQLPGAAATSSSPVWTPACGAALMASGVSSHKASILPRSLVEMRQRRLRAQGLKIAVRYLFILMVIFLMGAIFKQRSQLGALTVANVEARETLAEVEASIDLLNQRDALAMRIEPIVLGQLNTFDTLKTFRKVQQVQRDFEFSLIRFSDRQSYFSEVDDQPDINHTRKTALESEVPGWRRGQQAYVVEIMIRGAQAERLQILGDIVGRLREESYFANVDRLVGHRVSLETRSGQAGENEVYALLLTLAEQPQPADETRKAQKGG